MDQNNRGLNMICPNCGKDNCELITETYTKGKDVSAGKACCGNVLFGPAGLICGLCGKGKQTKSDTFFVCKECGNKFKA